MIESTAPQDPPTGAERSASEAMLADLRLTRRRLDETVARLVRSENALARTRSRAARERRDARQRELRSREAAEAFLAVMSHELRTPLTSIRGNVALLSRDPGRSDAPELLADVLESTEALSRIIDDLLVLASVDRGKLELTAEPALLQHLAPRVAADVLRRRPAARIELPIAPDLAAVFADATALRQVLDNLLVNAATYAGAEGPIEMTAREVGNQVEVTVRDHGPGLGDNPAALFAPFYRDPATAGTTSGAGIGLYVVRELLRAMGSSIEAGSREPHGAVFTFRLPAVTDTEA